MEATSANLLRKECQGCSETRRPSRPASRIQSSGVIVTSQPWIELTGGYARWVVGSLEVAMTAWPVLLSLLGLKRRHRGKIKFGEERRRELGVAGAALQGTIGGHNLFFPTEFTFFPYNELFFHIFVFKPKPKTLNPKPFNPKP